MKLNTWLSSKIMSMGNSQNILLSGKSSLQNSIFSASTFVLKMCVYVFSGVFVCVQISELEVFTPKHINNGCLWVVILEVLLLFLSEFFDFARVNMF